MKKLMAQLKELFFTREFIRYFISGLVATIVDLGVFTLLSRQLGLSQWYWSNLPAIIASVVAAYVMNRLWVFHSDDHVFREFLRFSGTRVGISAFFTYLFYPLLYYVLNIRFEIFRGLPLARFLALLFVILGNRVTGKFYVFRSDRFRKEKAGSATGDLLRSGSGLSSRTSAVPTDDTPIE